MIFPCGCFQNQMQNEASKTPAQGAIIRFFDYLVKLIYCFAIKRLETQFIAC